MPSHSASRWQGRLSATIVVALVLLGSASAFAQSDPWGADPGDAAGATGDAAGAAGDAAESAAADAAGDAWGASGTRAPKGPAAGGGAIPASWTAASASSDDFLARAQSFDLFRAPMQNQASFWIASLNNDFDIFTHQALIAAEYVIPGERISLFGHWGFQWEASRTGNSGIAPLFLGAKFALLEGRDSFWLSAVTSFGLPTNTENVNSIYMPDFFLTTDPFDVGTNVQWRLSLPVLYAFSSGVNGLQADLNFVFHFGAGGPFDESTFVFRIEYFHELDSVTLHGGFEFSEDDPNATIYFEGELTDTPIWMQAKIITEDAPDFLFNIGYRLSF